MTYTRPTGKRKGKVSPSLEVPDSLKEFSRLINTQLPYGFNGFVLKTNMPGS